MKKIFYTDGSSKGNPGPGGYGVVEYDIKSNIIFYVYSEYFKNVTNNQMELKAILHVLKIAAEHKEYDFTIYSDSAYAVNSINNWIYGWARNGWVNSKKKPVENLDLMQEIYKYVEFPMTNVILKKIDGHKGILGNEFADALATNNKKKLDDLIHRYDIAFLYMFNKEA